MSDYREYPRMLYRDGQTCLVYDEAGLTVALEAGWGKYLHMPSEATGDRAPAESDAPEAAAKRKPGRPKKTEEG